MIRTFLASAAVATLSFAAPALADGSYYYHGPYGGYAQGNYHTAPGHASRSFSVEGVYGGGATLNISCTRGAGCSREWNRTLRNGATASRTVTVQRGVGITRSGIGFRGRKW